MSASSSLSIIRPAFPGIIMSLVAILFGFSLGGVFGAFEDNLKDHLMESAQPVISTVYSGDTAKAKAVVKKSWSYMKRAHMHAGAIGTAALSVCLLLALLSLSEQNPMSKIKKVNTWMLGLGALGYPLFWLLAALRAPALGSTGAAKESLKWLALPSAFCCIAGVAMAIALVSLHCIQVRGHQD